MNLTWHIVRKDIVRLRFLLLPWLGLAAVQIFLCKRLLSSASLDTERFVHTGMGFNLTAIVGLILTFFLAAMLVLEDPLAGTDTFWVTRPISGRKLLAAKLIAAVLLLGLPVVVVWLPWWLYCGYGFSDLLTASARMLSWQAAAVLSGFVLASQVGRASRFVLVVIVLVTVVLVMALMAFAYGFQSTVPADLFGSRLLLALGIGILSGGAGVWWQYTKRGTNTGMAILAGGIVLAVTVVAASPWDTIGAWRASHWRGATSAGLTGRIEYARDALRSDHNDPSKFLIDLGLSLSGLPDDQVVGPGWADVELRWPDGKVVTQRQRPFQADPDLMPIRLALGLAAVDPWRESWDPETDAWLPRQTSLRPPEVEMIRGREVHVAPGTPRHDLVRLTLELSGDEMNRLNSEAPACRVIIHGILEKPVVLADMPLVAGMAAAGNGVRVQIAGLTTVTVQRPNPLKFTEGAFVIAEATDLGLVNSYWVDRDRGLASG